MDEDQIINSISQKDADSIDWTNAWSKKYPILKAYKAEVNVERYSKEINKMFNSLMKEYNYSKIDAMLVLKDILYTEWKENIK